MERIELIIESDPINEEYLKLRYEYFLQIVKETDSAVHKDPKLRVWNFC